MKAEQLKAILDAHALWLSDPQTGARADLSGSDLSGSNLSYSNLRGSNLSYSNLSGSDLSGSNLSGSDLSYSNLSGSDLSGSNLRGSNLRGSNLSGATGLFDAAAWIAANLQRTRGGVLAYKTFGNIYTAPGSWVIKPGAEIAENVNPLPTLDCACGVNVATLEWCQSHNEKNLPIWRVLVKWEWMAGGVIPYNTDGKFRVPRAKLIEVAE